MEQNGWLARQGMSYYYEELKDRAWESESRQEWAPGGVGGMASRPGQMYEWGWCLGCISLSSCSSVSGKTLLRRQEANTNDLTTHK